MAGDREKTLPAANPMLGLPPVPIPDGNLQAPEKISLGDSLFHDALFTIDGTVSCSTCHSEKHAFADDKQFSAGHHGLTNNRKIRQSHVIVRY